MSRALWAERAVGAHAAMRRALARHDGLYRRDGRLRLPGSIAHLWPFERALVATLDVAGIAPALTGAFDAAGEVERALAALERYWRPDRRPPAYASDVRRGPFGEDVYYDDNAWAGLALVQLERLRPGSGRLSRAAQLFALAVAGWDDSGATPAPGGVFWVAQGTGVGTRNHDRNTVSSAPNAQIGLHLEALTGSPPEVAGVGAREMIAWVQRALGGAGPDGRLYFDKIRGDGTIDRAVWSYNQGSMLGAHVLLSRLEPDGAERLAAAEAIAAAALDHYAGRYTRQPPAFNAIFFRNLLGLSAATADTALRRRIRADMTGYADLAWSRGPDRRGLVRVGDAPPTLLDQSALVSIWALLAWDPDDFEKIA